MIIYNKNVIRYQVPLTACLQNPERAERPGLKWRVCCHRLEGSRFACYLTTPRIFFRAPSVQELLQQAAPANVCR